MPHNNTKVKQRTERSIQNNVYQDSRSQHIMNKYTANT